MATGTFELYFQIAEVRVLALAQTCFGDSKNAFTALALEKQLLYLPAELSVQRLYLISGHLSAVGAFLVLRVTEIGDLFLQAKNVPAMIAHHWVKGEEETKGADEFLNQLRFVRVNCVCLFKFFCQLSFVRQSSHICFYLLVK